MNADDVIKRIREAKHKDLFIVTSEEFITLANEIISLRNTLEEYETNLVSPICKDVQSGGGERPLPRKENEMKTDSKTHSTICIFLRENGFADGSGAIEETLIDQLKVFMVAMRVYQERNGNAGQGYNDLWKGCGWRGHLYEVRKKIERVWIRWWPYRGKKADICSLDDSYDIINYMAFFVRCAGDNNECGNWNWDYKEATKQDV